MLRTVTNIRIESVAEPLRHPRVASLSFRLLARAQLMGFLPEDVEEVTRLDLPLVRRIGSCLAGRGIAQQPALLLAQLEGADPANGDRVADALRQTIEAVDASPQPGGEWQPARELLGDNLLSRLVGISTSSLTRYAAGSRSTPDEVAWRLHGIARILAALVGSYNSYGTRRWFERPRTSLDGQAPAALVSAAESEDDEGFRAVLSLAESLAGAGAAA